MIGLSNFDLSYAFISSIFVAVSVYFLLMNLRVKFKVAAGKSPKALQDRQKTGLLSLLEFFKLNFAYHPARKLRKAKESCVRDLPLLMDILVLGLSAGLSFDASLEMFCSHSKSLLADYMETSLLEWRLGLRSRVEVLRTLASDLDAKPFHHFVEAVEESLLFGTPLARSLEQEAGMLRSSYHDFLQQRIEKAPVKMLIPLTTLIVPAMLIAILGPLAATVLQN